jgi:lysine 2,3-aminomutase
VLLRGVNDDPAIMKTLMHALMKARVRPYYIYMADQVAGGEHFRTTVQKGLEIIQALRGHTSGLAVPHFVIDAPGGGGKVPLLPEYVEQITDEEVVFRNYEGKRFVYKQPQRAPNDAIPQDDVVPIRVASSRTAEKKPVRAKRRKTGS